MILKNLKNALFVLSIDKKEYFDNNNWFYEEIFRTNHFSNIKNKSISKEYIIRNFNPLTIPLMKPINQSNLNKYFKKLKN